MSKIKGFDGDKHEAVFRPKLANLLYINSSANDAVGNKTVVAIRSVAVDRSDKHKRDCRDECGRRASSFLPFERLPSNVVRLGSDAHSVLQLVEALSILLLNAMKLS